MNKETMRILTAPESETNLWLGLAMLARESDRDGDLIEAQRREAQIKKLSKN